MKKNFKNIWKVLNPSQKKKFYTLTALIIIGMLSELLSIGMVFPVVSILFDTGNETAIYFQNIYSIFFLEINYQQVVIISLLLLLFVYFLKNLLLTLIAKIEVKKIMNIKFEITEKLYKKFIFYPFTFHSNVNSSNLINFTKDQIDSFSNSLFNCIILMAEILIIIGVLIILFVVEPMGTLIILLLSFSFGYFFYTLMKKEISFLSKVRFENNSLKIKNLQETFGAIKEVKIYNKEKFFLNAFNIFNKKVINIEGYETFLKRLPRLWFEFLCVLIFVLFLIFKSFFDKANLISLTPILGLFGVAVIRVIPSINRIVLAMQTISFGEAAITMINENLEKNLQDEKLNYKNAEALKFEKSIDLKKISFNFNNNNKVFNEISLTIGKGDFVGIFGETGVGKSTLLNLLLGLIHPAKGEIKVDDVNIKKNLLSWQTKIGFVPQNIYLLDESISKNIAFGFEDDKIDHKRLASVIKDSQLEKFINNLPNRAETLVGERGAQISGGQLQRIGIARALYINPDILIFDESTSSLDNETEIKIMETINNIKKNKTIIFVSHKKNPMKFCNKLYELKKNQLISREK